MALFISPNKKKGRDLETVENEKRVIVHREGGVVIKNKNKMRGRVSNFFFNFFLLDSISC